VTRRPQRRVRAKEREPFPAELPAAPESDVADVNLVVVDKAVEIAPGVAYNVWAWGHTKESATALGPPIHVREGQLVKFTITNAGSIPHSMDFHAARIAPNEAFKDVIPGESFSFEFVAGDPGVYMYHCGTKPVLAHIANGMYGAIVVEPADLPPADKEYVLVSSEWYLDSPGIEQPANLSMDKARAMTPDWVTWNGYASTCTIRSRRIPATPSASGSSPPGRASTLTSTSSERSSSGPGRTRPCATRRSARRPSRFPRAAAASST
jgi:FtsP/CotA-like multicopper oxidase with cupredoxin domain